MIVTCTNGNAKNRINGSRVTIWDHTGEIVDRFEVPKFNGQVYCRRYPSGKYGQRYQAAVTEAQRRAEEANRA
jgi:hypothetical protein